MGADRDRVIRGCDTGIFATADRRPAQRHPGACRADYEAHCASVPPGGMASLQCLQKNMSSLAPGCQSAVRAVEAPAEPKADAKLRPNVNKAEATRPIPLRPTPAAKPAAETPAASAPKAAAAAPARKPSSAQIAAIRSACRADYQRSCASVPPGGAAALNCLEQNKAKLSASCQQAVNAAGGGAAPAANGAAAATTAAPDAAPRDDGAAADASARGVVRAAVGMRRRCPRALRRGTGRRWPHPAMPGRRRPRRCRLPARRSSRPLPHDRRQAALPRPAIGRWIVRIAVIGGGPGGLYFAYLWKKRHPDAHIDLFEQNAAGATWGFGVVFSDQALEFLRADDPETVEAIAPRMESWNNITLNLRGESVAIDGVGFSSIGRLDLLTILQQRVAAAGVTPHYDHHDTVRGRVDRLRPDRRRRRPEFAGAPQLRGRVRRLGVVVVQQVRLVRHHQTVRDAVADLCRRPSSAPSTPIITAIRLT